MLYHHTRTAMHRMLFPPFSLDPQPPLPLPNVRLFFTICNSKPEYSLDPVLTTASFNESPRHSPVCHLRMFSGKAPKEGTCEVFATLYNLPAILRNGVIPLNSECECYVYRLRLGEVSEDIGRMLLISEGPRHLGRGVRSRPIVLVRGRPIGVHGGVTSAKTVSRSHSLHAVYHPVGNIGALKTPCNISDNVRLDKKNSSARVLAHTISPFLASLLPGTKDVRMHHLPYSADTEGIAMTDLKDTMIRAAERWREHCDTLAVVRILDKKLVCAIQDTLDPLPLGMLSTDGGFALDYFTHECPDGTSLDVTVVGCPIGTLKNAVLYQIDAMGVGSVRTGRVIIRVEREDSANAKQSTLILVSVNENSEKEEEEDLEHATTHVECMPRDTLLIEILKRLYPDGTTFREAFLILLNDVIHIHVDVGDFINAPFHTVEYDDTAKRSVISKTRSTEFRELDLWNTFGKEELKVAPVKKPKPTGATTVLSVPRLNTVPQKERPHLDWSVQATRASEERKNMLPHTQDMEKKARLQSILANGCFWRGCKAGKFTKEAFWLSAKCEAGHEVKFHEVCLLSTRRGAYLERGTEAANGHDERWTELACLAEACDSTLVELSMRASTHRKKVTLVKEAHTEATAPVSVDTLPDDIAPRLSLAALAEFEPESRMVTAHSHETTDEKLPALNVVATPLPPKRSETYLADVTQKKPWKPRTRPRRARPKPQSLDEFREHSDVQYPEEVDVQYPEKAEDGVDLNVVPEIDKSYIDKCT